MYQPEPYRGDGDPDTQLVKLRHKLVAAELELQETQDSLALERSENRLLKDENGRLTRRMAARSFFASAVGMLRWGMNRGSAALMGSILTLMVIGYTTSGAHPEPSHHRSSHSVSATRARTPEYDLAWMHFRGLCPELTCCDLSHHDARTRPMPVIGFVVEIEVYWEAPTMARNWIETEPTSGSALVLTRY